MFGFIAWTAVVATLVQGYSTKSVRLEVQIYRWNMTEEEVAKAHFPYGIPKDAKPEVSLEFDVEIGKEQHVETRVGKRTIGAVATVSKFDGYGFFGRFTVGDRTDTDTAGFPSAFQGAVTEIALWPGQRCVIGGSCQSNTSDGKTEGHGDAITVRVTRPILPLAEPISRPARAVIRLPTMSAFVGGAVTPVQLMPAQQSVVVPVTLNSKAGCGSCASVPGVMVPISNARR
jgi:hypothetical protein